MPGNTFGNIKPEITALITATLAAYGLSPESGYRVAGIKKKANPWKKAGLKENLQPWQDDRLR